MVKQVDLFVHIYRQCRHAFHTLSANIEVAVSSHGPAVLMALSSNRCPTFREMFPGIKEDIVSAYGQAATLQLPGKHIAMVNRCLSNRDVIFTDAVERCAKRPTNLLLTHGSLACSWARCNRQVSGCKLSRWMGVGRALFPAEYESGGI